MKRFKKVYIEITNVCNLSCNFCPKTGRKLQFSDEERFKEIIEKVKPYTDYVYFHLMGEPLLNKNLARFLDICYENGLKVNITTNGTLLENSACAGFSCCIFHQDYVKEKTNEKI